MEYEKYLNEIIALSRKVKKPDTAMEYPASLDTNAKRALYDNLGNNEELAIELDRKIMTTKKDVWRDNKIKTREVEHAVKDVLDAYQIKEPGVEYVIELAKKPVHCLEYIIAHEMVHLLGRRHTERFIAFMDNCLPK